MTQRKITVADILSTKPCYPKTRVERLFDDLAYVTIEQILACDIAIADRVWVGVYLLAEKAHVVEFAKKCAKRAKGYVGSADPTSAIYVDYAAFSARAAFSAANAARIGDAAAYATYAADYATTAARAYYATSATAFYAANASADDTYAAYAEYTAYTTANAGDAGIERDHQITHLLELHKREEKV